MVCISNWWKSLTTNHCTVEPQKIMLISKLVKGSMHQKIYHWISQRVQMVASIPIKSLRRTETYRNGRKRQKWRKMDKDAQKQTKIERNIKKPTKTSKKGTGANRNGQKIEEERNVIYHVSRFTCHLSSVTCHQTL